MIRKRILSVVLAATMLMQNASVVAFAADSQPENSEEPTTVTSVVDDDTSEPMTLLTPATQEAPAIDDEPDGEVPPPMIQDGWYGSPQQAGGQYQIASKQNISQYGIVDFWQGSGADKSIKIIPYDCNRVYGDEFRTNGFLVVVNGVDIESVKPCIMQLDVALFADVEQNGITPAGMHSIYASIDYSELVIDGVSVAVTPGSSSAIVYPKEATVYPIDVYSQYGMLPTDIAYKTDGLINGDVLDGQLGSVADVTSPVGDYDITLGTLANPNYKLTLADNVGKHHIVHGTAIVKATVDGQVKAGRQYGEANPELSFTVDGLSDYDAERLAADPSIISELLGGVPVVETDATIDSIPGDYEVKASGLTSQYGNYNIVMQNAVLNVRPRNLNAIVGSAEKTYGTQDPIIDIVYTWEDGSPVEMEGNCPVVTDPVTGEKVLLRPLAYTVEREKGENADTYAVGIKYTGQSPDGVAVYQTTQYTGKLIIHPACLSVEFKEKQYSSEYGDAPYGFTADDLVISGFVTNHDLEIADDLSVIDFSALSFSPIDYNGAPVTEKTHPSEGAVSASGLIAQNYEFAYTPASYKVVKRPITVEAKAQTSIYGDKVTLAWEDYTQLNNIYHSQAPKKTALCNGDMLNGLNFCEVTEKTGAGVYEIAPIFYHPDYDINLVSSTFTVEKRPLIWGIFEQAGVYGNELKPLENLLAYDGDTTKPTIVNNDNLNATITVVGEDTQEVIKMNGGNGATVLTQETTPTTLKHKGVYSLVGQVDNDNYEVKIQDGRYSIGEREVVIIYQQQETTYGDVCNPDIKFLYMALNGDGTSETVNDIRDLGLELRVEYIPFADDALPIMPLQMENKVTVSPPEKAEGEDMIIFHTEGLKDAGLYGMHIYSDATEDYAVAIRALDKDGNPAFDHYRDFVVMRKDVTVSLPEMEKMYGEETDKDVIPTPEYEGFAFEETAETANVPPLPIRVDEAVQGTYGDEGVYENAFFYEGGRYGNYNYSEAYGTLRIGRESIETAGKVSVVGAVADENGNPVTTDDQDFSKVWSVSKALITAPEGYQISTSDSLEENEWSDYLTIEENGRSTHEFFFRNTETGAITTAGEQTLMIDTVAPQITEVAVMNDDGIKSLLNNDFAAFDKETEVQFTGVDEFIMPRVRGGSVGASGVVSMQYYTVTKEDAKFDAQGGLVVDSTKFQDVVLQFDENNHAVSTIRITPDFVGYIVTRTKDNAGQYSAPAVASISVVASQTPAPNPDPNPGDKTEGNQNANGSTTTTNVAKGLPATGDTFPTTAFVLVFGISILGFAGCTLLRRRKNFLRK